MIRDFQSIFGRQAREQFLQKGNKLSNYVLASIDGGSNSIGMVTSFLNDVELILIRVESAGKALNATDNAATNTFGTKYISIDGKEYIDAFMSLSQVEGIISAFESAHAGVHAMKFGLSYQRSSYSLIIFQGGVKKLRVS